MYSDKKKERDRRWRENNLEKAREGNRRRQARYTERHRDEINERKRERRQNPEIRQQAVDYGRNRRRALKQQVYELFGNKCCHCGFSDQRALQIDHINGGGKKSRQEQKAYATMYRDILINPTPYQLLCANCNWIKRWENRELGKAAQYDN